ncbi:MAG TPA: DNA repair protein RecN [Gemmatimonadales bacterium]|nr:DNA repair protein RecN [Gemmatimonadales bacterium]
MLTELRIRNFAIIESLTLPLAPGFNVLTGETGAGKSIIVEALGLLLGERAAADLVRTGSDRATVEGVFEREGDAALRAELDSRGIDADDGLVVLKREVSSSGRTRAWINGSTVTAGVLAGIGRRLVNLHGQHEAQSLLDTDAQRQILDAFGGATDTAAQVRQAHDDLLAARGELSALRSRRADAQKRADYLRHVAAEIEEAGLTPGEDVTLEDEFIRLEHADELRTMVGEANGLLDGEGAVLPGLGAVQRLLASLQKIDPAFTRLQELFDTGYYAVEELARELEAYGESVELDPERLAEVQRRKDVLFRLTSKYGPTLDDVIEAGRSASRELELVDSGGLDMQQLEQRVSAVAARLSRVAADLTRLRKEASRRLSSAVEQVLPELGMVDGRFSAALIEKPEPGANGAEDVEFRVSLNLGHEARPLARVASGGELSRVMLALKTILARLDQVPTLVFDEVDAGIGGVVGLKVGATMRRVAKGHQVFAITHLPQIAARAHHHFLVAKGARGGVTTADVRALRGEHRIREVARMLGGDPESELSRAHASELLEAEVENPKAADPDSLPGERPTAKKAAARASDANTSKEDQSAPREPADEPRKRATRPSERNATQSRKRTPKRG